MKKSLLIALVCMFCLVFTACKANEKAADTGDKSADIAAQKDDGKKVSQETKGKPDDKLIKSIIEDFEIGAFDEYKVDETDYGYLIHDGDVELKLDKDYRVLEFYGSSNLNKKGGGKYKSLEDLEKMLFDKAYVSKDYEFNRKYPILEDGYVVYLAKKYPNGIFNPYDSVKFSYEIETNRIITFKRVEEYVAQDNPKVSKEEAEALAVEALKSRLKMTDDPQVLEVDYRVVTDDFSAEAKGKGAYAEVYDVSFKEGSVYIDSSKKEAVFIDLVKTQP